MPHANWNLYVNRDLGFPQSWVDLWLWLYMLPSGSQLLCILNYLRGVLVLRVQFGLLTSGRQIWVCKFSMTLWTMMVPFFYLSGYIALCWQRVFGINHQFHVDNLKVSHKDQAVLEGFLTDLRDEFGQDDKLTENKGLVHKYLGIQWTTQFHLKLYS